MWPWGLNLIFHFQKFLSFNVNVPKIKTHLVSNSPVQVQRNASRCFTHKYGTVWSPCRAEHYLTPVMFTVPSTVCPFHTLGSDGDQSKPSVRSDSRSLQSKPPQPESIKIHVVSYEIVFIALSVTIQSSRGNVRFTAYMRWWQISGVSVMGVISASAPFRKCSLQ